MLGQQDMDALVKALQNKLQVTLTYTKEKTGEIVTHTGGLYEIGTNKKGMEVCWLWDTGSNDSIRQFLIANINSLQVLDIPFFPPNPWPLKLNGQILGY